MPVVKNSIYRVKAYMPVVNFAIYRVWMLMPVVNFAIYRVLCDMPVVGFLIKILIINILCKISKSIDRFEINQTLVFL